VALTGARVIDGTGAAPIDSATLLIENGRIAAVGPASAVSIPESAARVALTGKAIIPGLINSHGHVQAEPDSRLPLR
jgi:imidazolonepropionase-like amidohydrolase